MHFDDIYDLVDAVVDRFSDEEDKYDENSDADMPFVCVVAGFFWHDRRSVIVA